MRYSKPWLPLKEQAKLLDERGVDIGDKDDKDQAVALLNAIGYYRLSGYLYPFRKSASTSDDQSADDDCYRPGTTLYAVKQLIDFDRRLRLCVLGGVERIEVAVRMQLGYTLGEHSRFAHEEVECFMPAFTEVKMSKTEDKDLEAEQHPGRGEEDKKAGKAEDGGEVSEQTRWLSKVSKRVEESQHEPFVKHFKEKYDGGMPIWVLTELLQFGQLTQLYKGLKQPYAEEVSKAFGVPRKRCMVNWMSALNYVRNVAAHHGRLFNRKLQTAFQSPKAGEMPLLEHLREKQDDRSRFGVYRGLAVMAYLLRSIDPECGWAEETRRLLADFPVIDGISRGDDGKLSLAVMGAPNDWDALELWKGPGFSPGRG